MSEWKEIAKVNEFSNGSARNIAGVTVFYVNDKFYITGARCPHMGYPMSKGTIRNGIVTCAWHKWDFDLKHGGCYRGACDDLPVYEHKIENDALFIKKTNDSAKNDNWKRLLRESMMQGDRFLLAKVIAQTIHDDVALEEFNCEAFQQAFEHAIRAHQSMQGIRELHAIQVCSDLSTFIPDKEKVSALLQGCSIASGPSGFRTDVVPLPDANDAQRLQDMLAFYTSESSALGIERILLSSNFSDHALHEQLLSLATSAQFIHHAEIVMGLAICLDLRDQLGSDRLDHIFAAEIAWIMGATRPQANADAQEAMAWLQEHQVTASNAKDIDAVEPDAIADCLDKGSVVAVFDQVAAWLDAGHSVESLIDRASLLCARRFARLSLNNGGLWRDATRGIRLCVLLRKMCKLYTGVFQKQAVFILFFHLFESRWLQHREAWDGSEDASKADWKGFAESFDALQVRQARQYALDGFCADQQQALSEFVGQMVRDDLNYEQLACLKAVLEEIQHQDEWQPYLVGMITYAIDQRSSRNNLAAAQFGNSFQHDHAST